jgi:hypothetical protein
MHAFIALGIGQVLTLACSSFPQKTVTLKVSQTDNAKVHKAREQELASIMKKLPSLPHDKSTKPAKKAVKKPPPQVLVVHFLVIAYL